MKYKAIIFDMDGTTVNTEKLWETTTHLFIESKGIIYTEALKSFFQPRLQGLSLAKSCQLIKEHLNLTEEIDDLVKEKSAIAHNLYKSGITFIEGFEAFHAKTQEHKLKTGLATNAHDAQILLTDQALNLRRFFKEHMYGISQVAYKGKPDPAIYLHAAQQLDCKPEECIAIEDSAHGIAAAVGAGMLCIGINTARRKEQVQAAHVIVDGYHEIDLKKLIESSNQ
ncbi:MAG: HAD family phosphatase [Candidatus Babeliaceae bacterium]